MSVNENNGSSSDEIFEKILNFSSKKDDTEKKLKPSEKLLNEIKKSGYDMTELEGILKQKGNILIASCAGSGKTTALVFKIMYDLSTGETTRVIEINGNHIRVPERIWVGTFLKTGAEELERTLSRQLRAFGMYDASSAISFSTIHAEYKRALVARGLNLPIISEADNTKFLKGIVDDFAIRNSYGRALNSENLKDLQGALTYTRNRLDKKRYSCEAYDTFNITPSTVDAILRTWKYKRAEAGVMDFEDIQEVLYDYCYNVKDEDTINLLRNRYAFIYEDEFQDISQIQYAVLKVYASGARKIIAIGDDDQTIYSWRGSCVDIITKEFKNDFNPVIKNLSLNFRCPSNILNAIIPSIEKNKVRLEKTLKAAKEGGLLRIGSYTQYTGMVNMLIWFVEKDIARGFDVAILCRTNVDGLMPALIFDSANKFPFSISGEGMTLDSYVGRLALGIVRMFTDTWSANTEKCIGMLTPDKFSVTKLARVCKNNRTSFWDLDRQDLLYSCPTIASVLGTWITVRKNNGDINCLLFVLNYYRSEVFKKDTQFNRVSRAVLLGLITLLQRNNYKSIADYLDDLESINERLKARKKSYSGVRVRIATVHEFKGKEADSVYVWNDSETVFPYGDEMTGDEYEEERRVHYIACTRAKKISTILYMKGEEGDFLTEMNLDNAKLLDDEVENTENYIGGSSVWDQTEKRNFIDFKKRMKQKREEVEFRKNFKIIESKDEEVKKEEECKKEEGKKEKEKPNVENYFADAIMRGLSVEEMCTELESMGYGTFDKELVKEYLDEVKRYLKYLEKEGQKE